MFNNHTANVARTEEFSQVCIWPGCILKDASESLEFETWMKTEGIRIKYLETIITKPDVDSNGESVKDTGGRHDVLFAVHNQDIPKFALFKFQYGMRYIEDAMSNLNNYQDNPIYPNRLKYYKTWEA